MASSHTHPRRPPRFHLGSLVPASRHRLDEGLVVTELVSGTDGGGLLVCFGRETFRADIRHPSLNEAEAVLPHPLAVRSYTVSDGHTTMLHVTLMVDQHRICRCCA